MNFYCSDREFEDFLADYWSCEDYENFTYTQKYLIEKYNLTTEKRLEKLVVKIGYGYSVEEGFFCTCCNKPYQFETRKEFKFFIKYYFLKIKVVCKICKQKNEEEYFKKNYDDVMDMVIHFNKIYRSNFEKKYRIDFLGALNQLNYSELIYLNLILFKIDYQPAGKVSNNKLFYRFLNQEFYEENFILEKLYNHGLFFYCKSLSLSDYVSKVRQELSIGFSSITNRSEVTNKILKDFGKMNLDLFNVIFKPSQCSFYYYKELILEKIYNYDVGFDDWVKIVDFFKFLRKNEILFLASVVKYNNDFCLKENNAINHRINFLQENYNLEKIYGFFDSSVNQSLFVLDRFSDRKRFLLKNVIYNKLLISNKNKPFYEKTLPQNYIKSNFIKFFEEQYELESIWERLCVNEFVEILFEKMKSRGGINFD